MIHIYHTPASILARQRQYLASKCAVCVLAVGLLAAAGTTLIKLPEQKTVPECNFVGVEYFPAPLQTTPQTTRRLIHPPTIRQESPSLPELPQPTPDLALQTGEIDTPVCESSEEMEPEFDFSIFLQFMAEPPVATGQRKKHAEADTSYTPPDYLQCPHPHYPPLMRQRRAEGTVSVLIDVSDSGTPTHVTIIQSSGFEALDNHARAWILQHWTFSPARQNNRPLSSQVRTSITFTLHG